MAESGNIMTESETNSKRTDGETSTTVSRFGLAVRR